MGQYPREGEVEQKRRSLATRKSKNGEVRGWDCHAMATQVTQHGDRTPVNERDIQERGAR